MGSKRRILVLLQNTYNLKYAGRVIPRRTWERLLTMSVSWRRLQTLGVDPSSVDNANPLCGELWNSRLPFDADHVVRLLVSRAPEAVVACGSVAQEVAKYWSGPLLGLPHPAHFPADRAYEMGRSWLERGYEDRVLIKSPNSLKVRVTEFQVMAKSWWSFWNPVICLAHNTAEDAYYCLLFVKHKGFENAHRYHSKFVDPFFMLEGAVAYARGEFSRNVARHAAGPLRVRVEDVFEWDGEGDPDPGPWVFPTDDIQSDLITETTIMGSTDGQTI